ncbi:MAG: hypothetical protein WD645_04635, partial [Dehalococcoidia bacterium]
KAVVTGPTQRQVEEVVWREMRVAYAMAGKTLRGKMYASRYVVDDERFAIGFSTDSPFNLQGFHSPELLVMVTEAHAVAQDHMEALKRLNPRLLVLTGNPLTLAGEFYESHHGKSALYARLGISVYDTPNWEKQDTEHIPGMLTREDVEERKKEWGEDHNLSKAAVLGQFPEALEDTLIPLTLLREAVERWAVLQPPGSSLGDEPLYMGVDVARFGADKTVLCLRMGERVELVQALAGADTMQVAGHVADLVKARGIQAVIVDGNGVGGGVVDRLRELHLPVVDAQVGGAPRNRERFLNLRAELFWGLRQRFRDGRIAMPDDAELRGQLLSLKYDFTSAGQLRMEDKSALRAKGMPSPDKADALALAFMPLPSLDVWV